MAISSNATGLRPGVCTSTTRPTTPYTGMLIYETDTGYLRVWDGSAWDYLSQKQDDTVGLGPVGGLVLVNSVAVGSGVSSVTLNNAFNANFDSYRVIYSGGTMTSSSGDSQIAGRLGSATSGYYEIINYVLRASNTTNRAAGNENTTQIDWIGGGWSDNASADVTIHNPFLTVKTTWNSGNYIAWGNAGMGTTAGFINNTTSYSSFTLIVTGVGTISGGRLCSYGFRKS